MDTTVSNKTLHNDDVILNCCNKIQINDVATLTFNQLFELQAKIKPNNIAIIHGDEVLTYEQLNSKANQLARYIAKHYQKSTQKDFVIETLIGLCFERSVDMLIAILAVHKIGGAYIPIDPSYPTERIKFILDDTKSPLLLTQVHLLDKIKNNTRHNISLITVDDCPYYEEKTDDLMINNQIEALCYVIYTSGTTGKPKGVMINHLSFSSFLQEFKNKLKIEQATVLSLTSYTFDIFGLEYGLPLISGDSLILSNLDNFKTDFLKHQANIKIIQQTPSVLHLLFDKLPPTHKKFNIKCLVGGEAVSGTLISNLNEKFNQVINVYGPTETTIWSTAYICNDEAKNYIGKPLTNEIVYILDENLHQVAVGDIGELYIGGAGLARGYLNLPELTEKVFIINPFATQNDIQRGYTRLYKTGDLVRMKVDGNIEYVGRDDFQVKLRGYRVELSEIENTLLHVQGVKQAIVTLQPLTNNEPHLVAYYVADKPIIAEIIVQTISHHLPSHMVPSAYIHMKFFPLTINGKIDRKILPIPLLSDIDQGYVSPRNELEEKLCVLWQNIFKIEKVGIEDTFFSLGGHSILAIQCAYQMTEILNNKITSADIFSYKTIAGIVDNLKSVDVVKISRNKTRAAPLSFSQERLLFIEQFENGSNAYHIPILLRLGETIDVTIFIKGIREVFKRHEILHSRIYQDKDGKNFLQKSNNEVEIKYYDFDEKSIYLQQLHEDINKPFNFNEDLLSRIVFYTINNIEKYLLINFHHIIFDGWSSDIFFRELLEYYYYYKINSKLSLTPLTIQYNDYTIWQNANIHNDIHSEQLNYWTEKLKNYESLTLPIDKIYPDKIDYKGKVVSINIDEKTSDQLRKLAKSNGCSLYSLLLTGFYILLYHYTGQTDIVVGSPIANRQTSELKDLIGFFVNTVVLRLKINPLTDNFNSLIHAVQADLIDVQRYQDFPFESVVDSLGDVRDIRKHPIFQVMFGLQSFGKLSDSEFDVIQTVDTDEIYSPARFDLSLFIDDSENELVAKFTYATSIFNADTIHRIATHYKRILTLLVYNVDKIISEIDILSASEYQKIVCEWNATERQYNKVSIQQAFKEQVDKFPDDIALVFDNEKLTYRQLNVRANFIADEIIKYRNNNPCSNGLVGVYLDRSPQMVVAILAVLKSGCAYVPIDPQHPAERIKYILTDTQIKLLLTREKNIDNNIFTSFKDMAFIYLDEDQCHEKEVNYFSNINDLAYVIYTSGTTGYPKGVMVKHDGVLNMVRAQQTEFAVDSKSVVLQFSSLIFDASVWEIFNALTCGARLAIVTDAMRHDVDALIKFIENENVSIATFPPALLAQMPFCSLPKLKTLIVAGEVCDQKTILRWSNGRRFINAYGPTETTVCATLHHYQHGDNETIIGRPLQNMKAYVLNKYLKPVPIGVTGELYISGVGLALGYLNQPKLTNEKFNINPFDNTNGGHDNQLLYKTGDLVRYLADGNIQYMGRDDFQVKIHSHRIELSEIESLLSHEYDIEQCKAIARNQKIIVYYIALQPLDHQSLMNRLSKKLPAYMLPSALVHLTKFPININGKIDNNLLPKPEFDLNQQHYVAPRNNLEKSLCELWQKLLMVEQVGIHDDFFAMGGNSILAIQMAAQVSNSLAMKLVIADIFTYKTIAKLAEYVYPDEALPIIGRALEEYPLSFAQESLWFIEQYEQGTNAYHIPFLLDLNNDVNLHALVKSLNSIIDRHKILSSIFIQDNDVNSYQVIKENKFKISSYKFNTYNEYLVQRDLDVNKHFDLTTEPPIRASLYTVPGNGKAQLLINIHHIAFDGWSMGIFFHELTQFYNHYHLKYKINLPTLSVQYKDYAYWQRENSNAKELDQQLVYWKEQLEGVEAVNLPTDFTRPAKRSYIGNAIRFSLTKVISDRLRKLSQENGCSLYAILMSGFYLLLHKYSQQTDLVIGSPSANRHHPQTQNLIGYFINSLALRISIKTDMQLQDFMLQVNEVIIAAQRNQDLSFYQLVSQLNFERDASRHPIFQTMFNMLSSDTHSSNFPFGEINNEITIDNYVAKFDLLLTIEDITEENIVGYFNYSVDLFEIETIQRLMNHYKIILESFTKDSLISIKSLNLLTKEEQQQLLYDFNQTNVDYPDNYNLAQKFEEQVKRTPTNIALVFENIELTYQQLNQKANQLSRFLRSFYKNKLGHDLTADTLIVIYFDRSIEMVIAILAIYKAGGAYVPLSPDHPAARIQTLLNDCKASLVLTQTNFVTELSKIINHQDIIDVQQADFSSYSNKNLRAHSNSNNLACLLYTSGTTGSPKGVLIEHKNIINHIEWLNSKIKLTENDVVIQKANYIFDASVRELLWANWYGAKTVLAKPDGHKDSEYLFELIKKHQVKVIHFIPSMLDVFLMYMESTEKRWPVSLEYMMCGGEMLKEVVVDRCYQLAENKKFTLYNVYGPTETTINVTHALRKKQKAGVIGRPNSNTRTYILDAYLEPVPIGVVGELYIGGANVARGYLNQVELTQEKFIDNPFLTVFDKEKRYTKLYKTGDLARYLADGNIECLGRSDFQIKIRGYRIELAEIEQVLLNFNDIKQCVVVPRTREKNNQQNDYLVAYYVSKSVHTNDSLTKYLINFLPAYMVPDVFIHLNELPTTSTGKLNRNALPAPNLENFNKQYVAPSTQTESTLCLMWEELLAIKAVGVDEDFFSLGGNSLSTIQLLARIIKFFQTKITLKDIFESRTIRNIANKIDSMEKGHGKYIPPTLKKSKEYHLSFQHKLVLDYLTQHPTSILFQSGVALLFNEEIVESTFILALIDTIKIYPLFRTKFIPEDKAYKPIVDNVVDVSHIFSVEEKYIDGDEKQKEYSEQQRLKLASEIFDYKHDFLYKVKLIKFGNNKSVLILCLSRLLADGYSLSMFIKMLFKNYESIHSKQSLEYTGPCFDYFDYAHWQKQAYDKSLIQEHLSYWLDKYISIPVRNLLAIDCIRPDKLDGLCECKKATLNATITDNIREFSLKNAISVYSIFFGMWSIYLLNQSDQADIAVMCVHRNRNHIEFEYIQGPFSDYIPVRINNFPDYKSNPIKFFKYIDNLIREGLDNAMPYITLLENMNVNAKDKLSYCNFPFTQTAVNFPNPYFKSEEKLTNALNFEYLENTKHTTSFEISLVISETKSNYSVTLNYRSELFFNKTMDTILKSYIKIINNIFN